ncbi:MAG: response regulator [Thermodesulfobacteriota bacterium]
MDKKRILIVDDELLILRIISDILSKEGYEVKTAINFHNASQLLEEEKFDVVITDIRMPEKSGIDLLEHVRKINSDIPVILMTGFASLETAVDAVKQGAHDYLTKPLDFNKLKRIVSQSIERHELLSSNKRLVKELQEINSNLEIKVSERTRELLNILNSANESIVTTDLDLIIKTSNPMTVEIYGRDCVGQKLDELIGGVNFKTIIPKILKDSNYITKHEVKFGDKHLEMSLSQLVDFDTKEAFGVIVITDDITDKKKLEVQLLQSAKMSAVGQLAAGVAHEFNNVLSGIVGYTSLAMSRNDVDKIREDLTVVDKASNRAIEVVRKLLAFSRQKDEKYSLTNLDDVVDDSVSLVSNTLEKEGVKVLKHFGKTPPVKVNQGEIQQVILNLVINAKHAIDANTEISSEDKVIGITTEAVDNFVKLDISDTGIGIPKENIPKIFEPFFSTKDRNSKEPGTGLGLPITYAIIERHGGSIDVDSEIGKGTTFTIWIPFDQPFTNGNVPQVIDINQKEEIESARKANILVVDDDLYIGDLIKDSLKDQGHNVIVVDNGEEAINLFKENHFDIAFIDYMLPGVTGLEVIRKARSDNPQTALILITGSVTSYIAEEAVAEGATSFLQKPFTFEQIRNVVATAIGQYN